MTTTHHTDAGRTYSKPMVLRSHAGFYIGRLYSPAGFNLRTNAPNNPDEVSPGTRDSMGYYPTHKAAQQELESGAY